MSTLTRSATLPYATADAATLIAHRAQAAARPLEIGPIRLVGVGFSGLSDVRQESLFPDLELMAEEVSDTGHAAGRSATPRSAAPGVADRRRRRAHRATDTAGCRAPGHGVMTVRFETRGTGPGPVRTFRDDNPDVTTGQPGRQPGLARLRASATDCAAVPDSAPAGEDVVDGRAARPARPSAAPGPVAARRRRHHHGARVDQLAARPVAGADPRAGHPGRHDDRDAGAHRPAGPRRSPRRPRCPTPSASSTIPAAPAATQASIATASAPGVDGDDVDPRRVALRDSSPRNGRPVRGLRDRPSATMPTPTAKPAIAVPFVQPERLPDRPGERHDARRCPWPARLAGQVNASRRLAGPSASGASALRMAPVSTTGTAPS